MNKSSLALVFAALVTLSGCAGVVKETRIYEGHDGTVEDVSIKGFGGSERIVTTDTKHAFKDCVNILRSSTADASAYGWCKSLVAGYGGLYGLPGSPYGLSGNPANLYGPQPFVVETYGSQASRLAGGIPDQAWAQPQNWPQGQQYAAPAASTAPSEAERARNTLLENLSDRLEQLEANKKAEKK